MKGDMHICNCLHLHDGVNKGSHLWKAPESIQKPEWATYRAYGYYAFINIYGSIKFIPLACMTKVLGPAETKQGKEKTVLSFDKWDGKVYEFACCHNHGLASSTKLVNSDRVIEATTSVDKWCIAQNLKYFQVVGGSERLFKPTCLREIDATDYQARSRPAEAPSEPEELDGEQFELEMAEGSYASYFQEEIDSFPGEDPEELDCSQEDVEQLINFVFFSDTDFREFTNKLFPDTVDEISHNASLDERMGLVIESVGVQRVAHALKRYLSSSMFF